MGELARELNLPLAKVHYHATKLVDCGLLQVSRVEPRQGRPVKYYKAIAEAFLVNLADLGEQVSDGLARELRGSLAREVNRLEVYLRYYLDEGGRPRVRQVNPDGEGLTDRVLDHWKIMRLAPKKRAALSAELTALIARYEDDGSPEGDLYLVHAAFAPKLLDTG